MKITLHTVAVACSACHAWFLSPVPSCFSAFNSKTREWLWEMRLPWYFCIIIFSELVDRVSLDKHIMLFILSHGHVHTCTCTCVHTFAGNIETGRKEVIFSGHRKGIEGVVGHKGHVMALAVSSDGKFLVSELHHVTSCACMQLLKLYM